MIADFWVWSFFYQWGQYIFLSWKDQIRIEQNCNIILFLDLACAGRQDLWGSLESELLWGWSGWGRGRPSLGSRSPPRSCPPPCSGRFSELLGEGTLLNWCIFSIFALEGKQTQMATVHGIGTLKTNTHVSTKFLSLVFGRQGLSIGRSWWTQRPKSTWQTCWRKSRERQVVLRRWSEFIVDLYSWCRRVMMVMAKSQNQRKR